MIPFNRRVSLYDLAASAIALVLFTLICWALSGCKYMPDNSATFEQPRDLIPCELVPPGYPCQHPVVDDETACDKRFGRKVCRPSVRPTT